MRLLIFILFSSLCRADQPQPPKTNEPANTTAAPQPAGEYLNLLGKTDTQGGEAKRNDNVSFDLVDNNALKEQNSRLGTSATVIQEFLPQHSYFGAEFGNPPSPVLHTPAAALVKPWHGHYEQSTRIQSSTRDDSSRLVRCSLRMRTSTQST
jgi:hypothetical protein